MKVTFRFVITLLVLFYTTNCSKTRIEYKTIKTFTISSYEFEIDQVKEIEKKSGRVIKEYYDTTLANVCDFCKECEEEQESPDPIRR